MPFALINAPCTLHRTTNIILLLVKWPKTMVHLNKIKVVSKMAMEHIASVKRVITLLQKEGVV